MAETTASPSSASPSPTPTPTPTLTPTPTGAPTSTFPPGSLEDQLYKATVNFYSTINRAFRTLDTRPVADLLVPGSNAASGYTGFIERTERSGHRFDFAGEYVITNFRYRRDESNATERVEFNLAHQAGREVDANGKTVRTMPATSSPAWIVYAKKGDRWLVVSQGIEE